MARRIWNHTQENDFYNFKWFLHAMLYIHTQQVMNKQRLRDNKEGDQDEEGIDIEGEEE